MALAKFRHIIMGESRPIEWSAIWECGRWFLCDDLRSQYSEGHRRNHVLRVWTPWPTIQSHIVRQWLEFWKGQVYAIRKVLKVVLKVFLLLFLLQRVANLGPQFKFPVHEGILNYRGKKYVSRFKFYFFSSNYFRKAPLRSHFGPSRISRSLRSFNS